MPHPGQTPARSRETVTVYVHALDRTLLDLIEDVVPPRAHPARCGPAPPRSHASRAARGQRAPQRAGSI